MHPIRRKSFASQCLGLSYFILMMREYEINSAHMDIYLFTVSPQITRTTLDMPPWSSFESFWSFFCIKMSLPKIFPIRNIV